MAPSDMDCWPLGAIRNALTVIQDVIPDDANPSALCLIYPVALGTFDVIVDDTDEG
jgi:hypothetical protein